MARDDWYRRTSWSDADEQDFFERLGKSRSTLHQSQYLRLQAVTLVETKQPRLIRVALRLLERLFAEYPDPSQLAAGHLHAAECYEKLGDFPRATEQFRRALEAQALPQAPDVGVTLAFPWFVARHGLSDLYDEALRTLNKADVVFPVQIFREAAVRAIVADDRGDQPSAAQHARRALDAAGLKRSPFGHPSVGLVGPEYREVFERLGRMVG
jgi:tetratricopeptide (TPR) repeat protein